MLTNSESPHAIADIFINQKMAAGPISLLGKDMFENAQFLQL